MSGQDTKYETGGRIFPAATGPDPSDEFSQEAAKNRKPRHGMGLTESLDETDEKARHSEGQDPPEEARPEGRTVDEP